MQNSRYKRQKKKSIVKQYVKTLKSLISSRIRDRIT